MHVLGQDAGHDLIGGVGQAEEAVDGAVRVVDWSGFGGGHESSSTPHAAAISPRSTR